MSITKKNHPIYRLLCLTLVLAMLLGIAGCTVGPATAGPSQSLEGPTGTTPTQTTAAPTTPTEAPTQPTEAPTQPTEPTEPPTEPTEPPYVEPSYPNLPAYELTQEDVDEFYSLLESCEALSLGGENMQAIEAVTDLVDAQYEYLNTQCSIAMILYYANMKDQVLSQRYLDCVDIVTSANDAYIQMTRRVYQSDSPAKEALFADWTEEEIAQLLAYDSRVAELQKRKEEIEVEYEAAVKDEDRIRLYIELVQNNNEMAQIYGYDNYYTYAYEMVYERDYSLQELEQMRQYAKTYLAGDTLATAYNNFYDVFYALAPGKQQSVINFLFEDYDTMSSDYIGRYLSAMPASLQEHTQQMLEIDSLFVKSTAAMSGAFTTTIGDRSYCFFGPDYANCCTVIHEAGHYYASRYQDLNSIPLDLAETHSQGNEWLFVQSLNGKMNRDQYKALVNYRLYNDLSMILICLMVDEFEQQVYSTDISGYTALDFDKLMNSICGQYCSAVDATKYLTDMGRYWRAVVVDQPVYYISYAVSSIAAIDLYNMAKTDFAAAAEAYRKLCEEAQEELGFLGNITAAGLAGPFQEEFYIEFAALIKGSN